MRRLGFYAALGILILWSIGPVYWALVTSVTPPNALVSDILRLWPEQMTFEHYAKLFGATSTSQGNEVQSVWPQFSQAFFNSLLTAFAATVLTVLIAAFGGWAFVRLRFPGRDLIFVVIVGTLGVPAYTVMIPLYRIMISAGLVDTYTGVVLIYVSAFLPLALWLMRSVYQAMPLSLEEAAWLDGASKLYTLVRIVLPLAGPGLVATAILTFLSAWGQFMVPLVFSPTLDTKPLTVLIPEFVTRNYVDYGLMNAAGIVAIVPPVLLVIFLNRFLVQGLMAGASK
ncbi:carbohydrate ABC transporter permease [Phyllobacterium myrsinacearum]|uniref:ABC transporter permease n=1 Tax=Phyllobacterium myrsinacearum TaxID=28101 RepID=A0A2S9JP46_9HYPH|nr:carbohydrate ABC transporter permease [Phyllobacterium myrsinacearum]PRD54951.1 ABC transporter permease [Phyllobacterium myrsinacearum]PWV90510.1 carbohydrate ABC transporter membrane protein 2 (CUT1 family) [Phyllobacterium myrsinacearum]RZS79907.1 carbohydrate ABC transporter membrane protein 2 (CUT1 family) [Phyllobacterium myrsinacearum]RZV05297.1 carbohydrate ABC transporter membrane protein 2 (CUT1 family) [Phyllobacterium myrsinacearum]